ncbi:MAG: hypothetical protein ACRCYX_03590 [Dermatophilaceae bacterium]
MVEREFWSTADARRAAAPELSVRWHEARVDTRPEAGDESVPPGDPERAWAEISVEGPGG